MSKSAYRNTVGKVVANRGVARNKRPLPNKIYWVEVHKELDWNRTNKEEMEKYKFKDEGYLVLSSSLQTKFAMWQWHGFITPDKLKEFLGEKQWGKFCQGKRKFIIQRRVDGRNTPIGEKEKLVLA